MGVVVFFMISRYLISDFFVIFFTAVEIFGPHEDYAMDVVASRVESLKRGLYEFLQRNSPDGIYR